jgi:hypothetical protein
VTAAQDVVFLIPVIGTENSITSEFMFSLIANIHAVYCTLNLATLLIKNILLICPFYLLMYFLHWHVNLIFFHGQDILNFLHVVTKPTAEEVLLWNILTSCSFCKNIDMFYHVLYHHFFHAAYQTVSVFSSRFTKALQQSLDKCRFQVSANFNLYPVLPVMVLTFHGGRNQ